MKPPHRQIYVFGMCIKYILKIQKNYVNIFWKNIKILCKIDQIGTICIMHVIIALK